VSELARSSQEQQQMAAAMLAARDNTALYQIYQRYTHDPAMLQRQLSAYLAMAAAAKPHDGDVAAHMMDASHLVYHFASKIIYSPVSYACPLHMQASCCFECVSCLSVIPSAAVSQLL